MFWWRKKVPSDIAERQDALERAVRRLCDDVDTIDDQLRKVKGLIYAKKLHKTGVNGTEEASEPSDERPGRMSRQELKAWLTRSGRFTPGQPVKHSE